MKIYLIVAIFFALISLGIAVFVFWCLAYGFYSRNALWPTVGILNSIGIYMYACFAWGSFRRYKVERARRKELL